MGNKLVIINLKTVFVSNRISPQREMYLVTHSLPFHKINIIDKSVCVFTNYRYTCMIYVNIEKYFKQMALMTHGSDYEIASLGCFI